MKKGNLVWIEEAILINAFDSRCVNVVCLKKEN